jgi:hypothetical protein
VTELTHAHLKSNASGIVFTGDVVINLECRAWAHNIIQDRKEQLGVLNYKIKIE